MEWMTIAENIALATGYPRNRGLIDWRAAEAATQAALAKVNCPLDPSMRVRDLSRTEKSLVAIARALAVEAEHPRAGRAFGVRCPPTKCIACSTPCVR